MTRRETKNLFDFRVTALIVYIIIMLSTRTTHKICGFVVATVNCYSNLSYFVLWVGYASITLNAIVLHVDVTRKYLNSCLCGEPARKLEIHASTIYGMSRCYSLLPNVSLLHKAIEWDWKNNFICEEPVNHWCESPSNRIRRQVLMASRNEFMKTYIADSRAGLSYVCVYIKKMPFFN